LAPHRLVLHRGANRDAKAKDLSDERNVQSQRILRQIGLGGQILSDLGIRRIRLLTNTPTHIPALQGFGIEIVEQVRIPVGETATTSR
jgi:3,4-dihydroxy 2-butanone 4-phosphate synthase/GTP cyclohydrolase II